MGCSFSKQGLYSDGSMIGMPPALQQLQIDTATGEAEVVDRFQPTTAEKTLSQGRRNSGAAVAPEGGGEVIMEESRERLQIQHYAPPEISRNILRNIAGEQIAAGWPSWLVEVAGEAIDGWIPRLQDSFQEAIQIGEGSYSKVYRALDQHTGKIVALKKVCFDVMNQESVDFMAREIKLLRRLDHPNVIKLEGLVIPQNSDNCLYLVLEYMEHDLEKLSASPSIMFSEAQVKCYLQQLLRGLDHCHGRGVLHRDIKSANLLLDDSGVLKIADFGLAQFYQPGQQRPLTSKVVTLWYRPPELLLGATDYGAAVDLWSTGCILGELLTGKPILPGQTEVDQLHRIFQLCGSPPEDYLSTLVNASIFRDCQQPFKRCIADTFKKCRASSIALLETLLSIEPAARGSALEALKSEFFTAQPIACNPSIFQGIQRATLHDIALNADATIKNPDDEFVQTTGSRKLLIKTKALQSRVERTCGPD